MKRAWRWGWMLALVGGCQAPTPPNLLRMPNGKMVPASALDGGAPWSRELCHPLAEDPVGGAPSAMAVSGECDYTQQALADCHAKQDDFYIVSKRKLEGGRVLTLYINVERFRGAGDYEEAQAHIWIGEGTGLYRWGNARGHLTLETGAEVTPGDPTHFASAGISDAVLPDIVLDAEPGTLTSGQIKLSGKLRCLVKDGPDAFSPLAP